MTSDIVRQELTVVQEEKDPGDHNKRPEAIKTECAEAARKVTTALRHIRQSFTSIAKESFSILYNTYIRPYMEYCLQVWRSFPIKTLKLKRRATKLFRGLSNLPYEERLKQLDLFSLEAQVVLLNTVRDRALPSITVCKCPILSVTTRNNTGITTREWKVYCLGQFS